MSTETTDQLLERTAAKPTTLDGLLKALTAIDEAMHDIDFDDQAALMEDGQIKVDNYKFLKDKLDAMLGDLKNKESEYSKARKSIERQIEKLMSNMAKTMIGNGFEQFTGKQCKAVVRYYESVSMRVETPEDRHMMEYPEFIKTTYSWKKKELTPLLKGKFPKEDKEMSELADKAHLIAEIESTPKVHFSILKDL